MYHAVSKEAALKVAKELGAEYFEVSAKSGQLSNGFCSSLHLYGSGRVLALLRRAG